MACVGTDCDRTRRAASVRPANLGSRRILEKIGMTLDHCEEDHKGTLLFLSRTFSTVSA
ncbi:hypothetical protein GCM10023317_95400 [Actinopolymorpha pittospori]|uniref:RimJ/RimL family protein N-acetyltransferase n=1 Tax=Actinopolymorpha pittospori TaxID=648752 RepID=A0A927MY22_9ACTN|nr:RimJ/RimL family protein N-acetyltransferase [Actinopolymorpha pittospori]